MRHDIINNKTMGISRGLKTESLRAVIYAYTGQDPIINRYADYNEIEFTPDQATALQKQLTAWQKSEPGEVRVKVGSVLLPWSLKTYWAWIAGAVGVGAVLGFMMRK